MTKRESELADELDAGRGDESQWSATEAKIQVRPQTSQVVSFRMPTDEFLALTREAQRIGVSLADYIRGAIALRMEGANPLMAARITGRMTERFRSMYTLSGTENSEPLMSGLPDTPPNTVAM